MKKLSLTLFICLFFAFSTLAQTPYTEQQKSALGEITRLNNQTVELYKQKDYDAALKIALQVRDIAAKNGLSQDMRVLPMLTNLAEIYFVKDKFSEAGAEYEKILAAYQSKSGNVDSLIAKTTERLGAIYFFKKDYSKAEDYYQKALALRSKINGAESREVAKLDVELGNVYRMRKNYVRADEFYLKAIAVNDKVLTEAEKEKREDLSDYECFLYHKALSEDDVKGVSEKIKKFFDARRPPEDDKKLIDSGIVNGKALNLVRPPFPVNMRGLNGFVLVRVTIDEQGNVTAAKATCGILEFVKVVEDAARKSKFSPTFFKGQPVKVTGIIVYNFLS